MRTFLFLLLAAVLPPRGVQAQSIIGTWITVSQQIVSDDGTIKDMQAMQTKRWPCMANLQTIFEANGKQVMKVPVNCHTPVNYEQLPASQWTMSGHTLTLTNKSMPGMMGNTASYTVVFSGNMAVLTHEYTPDEKKKIFGAAKSKKVVITYQRQ